MKNVNRSIPTSPSILGLIVALAAYFVLGCNQLEIQVHDSKWSPDGRWTAVVQMEVSSTPLVSDAVYVVRLKGPAQKDPLGDEVMSVPVNYPKPEPSIEWSNGKLVVTLTSNQKSQYFATSVDGVEIVLKQK